MSARARRIGARWWETERRSAPGVEFWQRQRLDVFYPVEFTPSIGDEDLPQGCTVICVHGIPMGASCLWCWQDSLNALFVESRWMQ